MKAITLWPLVYLVALAAVALPEEPAAYNEKYRPQFHFSAKTGWLADPEALVFYKGEYHLLFLHSPNSLAGNPPYSWGHAVSPDLLHWRELSVAVEPDPGTKEGVWTGSAVVDWANSAGFKNGAEDVLVGTYTRPGYGTCLIYSNDRGRTWTKYAGNPVLPISQTGGRIDRDSRIFWHAPSRKWVLILSESDNQRISLYGSHDLKSWTRLSSISGLTINCPDLFELPVDGDLTRKKWVMVVAAFKPATAGQQAKTLTTQYVVGEFDGTKFTPEGPYRRLDWGRNFYSTQTWSDVPSEDGREIQVAWMLEDGHFPGMPFSQQFTIPTELTLQTFPDGLRLCRRPIREIETLRVGEHHWKNVILKPGQNPVAGVSGELLDIRVEVDVQDATEVSLGVLGAQVRYKVRASELGVLGSGAKMSPVSGRIDLRILADRSSLEVFANHGSISMTSYFTPDERHRTPVEIYSRGGPIKLISLDVYQLRSVWN